MVTEQVITVEISELRDKVDDLADHAAEHLAFAHARRYGRVVVWLEAALALLDSDCEGY